MTILDSIEKIISLWFGILPRAKPNKSRVEQLRLIAHRGAHNKKLACIENTDAAFARALSLGCWGIEFDIHATSDNVLIVNHDPTLNRLWQKQQSINQLTFEQLRTLVPKIPSLEEVINNYAQHMHLFIEIKAPFTAQIALKKVLQSLTPVNNYHLITLDEDVAASLTAFPSEAILLVAGHNNVSHFCNLSLKNNYGGVLGHYLLLTDRKLKPLRRAKKAIGVGQVDSKFNLYRELNRNIHWVFSNNIDLLRDTTNQLLFKTDKPSLPV